MGGIGIAFGRVSSRKGKGESLMPLLKQGERRNLSADTNDRLDELSAAIEALKEAEKAAGVDVSGLQEPMSVVVLAVEILGGVEMNRDKRDERASRGRHRGFAIAAVRGRFGRSGGTHAASRPFFGFPDRAAVR